MSNLNVTNASGGSTAAGFTLSTNPSGLVLGFSFSGSSILGKWCTMLCDATFAGDGGTLSVSTATMSDTSGSALTVDLGTVFYVGDVEPVVQILVRIIIILMQQLMMVL